MVFLAASQSAECSQLSAVQIERSPKSRMKLGKMQWPGKDVSRGCFSKGELWRENAWQVAFLKEDGGRSSLSTRDRLTHVCHGLDNRRRTASTRQVSTSSAVGYDTQ